MKAYTLGNKVPVRTPKQPELSNNGGDYFLYQTPIFKNGVQIGVLHDTSAEFDFCQISGDFTDTISLYCIELNQYISIRKHKMFSNEDCPNGQISIEELLNS